MSPDDATLTWTQLLLSVLDEGRRTATYKLAVLLALIDCCVLGTGPDGRAPQQVATRDLAARVLELYWGQVRPYAVADGPAVVLRQSSQPRAVSVDAVAELRQSTGAPTPAAARLLAPEAYERALDAVEDAAREAAAPGGLRRGGRRRLPALRLRRRAVPRAGHRPAAACPAAVRRAAARGPRPAGRPGGPAAAAARAALDPGRRRLQPHGLRRGPAAELPVRRGPHRAEGRP